MGWISLLFSTAHCLGRDVIYVGGISRKIYFDGHLTTSSSIWGGMLSPMIAFVATWFYRDSANNVKDILEQSFISVGTSPLDFPFGLKMSRNCVLVSL